MSNLPAVAITLHVLASIVWIGGMFFAFLALRPALAELELMPRARLMAAVLKRFFPWIWASVATLLVTGFYMALNNYESLARAPWFVHFMMGVGIFMMMLAGHLYFSSFKKLKHAVAGNDEALAKRALGQFRLVIGVNLALGLLIVVVVMLGIYLSSD